MSLDVQKTKDEPSERYIIPNRYPIPCATLLNIIYSAKH